MLQSRNVSTEVNTVFQNLVDVLHQIDPPKLNAVLTALAEGVRGQGQRIGEATTDANEVLLALNPRSDTIRRGLALVQGHFSNTYAAAAQDILHTLDAASTTSHDHHQPHIQAWMRCCSTSLGSPTAGINLLGPNQQQPDRRRSTRSNPRRTC